MGKNDVRPAGGWAGGRMGGRAAGRHAFVSGPLCENYFIYENWHIFVSCALVVPFGGHIAVAYIVFP